MTYKKFHDILVGSLTENQIAIIQDFAFQNYEDAHGHRPDQKTEKQMAYDFTINFIRNMNITECVRCLKPLGIPLTTAVNLWHVLE